jgi:hypothetical protein
MQQGMAEQGHYKSGSSQLSDEAKLVQVSTIQRYASGRSIMRNSLSSIHGAHRPSLELVAVALLAQ